MASLRPKLRCWSIRFSVSSFRRSPSVLQNSHSGKTARLRRELACGSEGSPNSEWSDSSRPSFFWAAVIRSLRNACNLERMPSLKLHCSQKGQPASRLSHWKLWWSLSSSARAKSFRWARPILFSSQRAWLADLPIKMDRWLLHRCS